MDQVYLHSICLSDSTWQNIRHQKREKEDGKQVESCVSEYILVLQLSQNKLVVIEQITLAKPTQSLCKAVKVWL